MSQQELIRHHMNAYEAMAWRGPRSQDTWLVHGATDRTRNYKTAAPHTMACEAISQDKWGGKQPIPQRESHRQVPGRLRTLRISCSNSELNRTVARTVHTINESLALHNPIHHQANTTSQPATQLAGCGSLLFSQVSQLS